MKYRPFNLNIQLDISTYCNARCPQCHRNVNDGLTDQPWLPKINWTLDQFKKAFPPQSLQRIKNLNFCPTWGDPVMNPNLMDMIKYCVDSNPLMSFTVDTNGSMQTEEWWFELGSITNLLNVVFAVDGIDQEMHSRYRRGTDLEKVLSNMEMYSQGLGGTMTQTIVFKHNQDYLEEINELVTSKGSTRHLCTVSTRFDRGDPNKSYFYDKMTDEEFVLERKTEKFKDAFYGSARKGVTDENIDQVFNDKANETQKPASKTKKVYLGDVTTKKVEGEVKTKDSIYCQWMDGNRVSITFDGQVYHCCYIANSTTEGITKNSDKIFEQRHPVIKHYRENKEDYNVFHDNLENIIQKPFFSHLVSDTWESDRTIKQCIHHCTKTGIKNLERKLIAKG